VGDGVVDDGDGWGVGVHGDWVGEEEGSFNRMWISTMLDLV
jgi:hypothetical protein